LKEKRPASYRLARAPGVAAKSLRSRSPVLHLNTIEFLEGN